MHTQVAFDTFQRIREDLGLSRFILDAGCGTGQSTLQLAQQFPDYLVVGIDQSEQRLGRGLLSVEQKLQLQEHYVLLGNCLLLRAEAADFWRLLSRHQARPEKIYIFYPNPWPKPGHLLRRWHAHPVFPTLMGLNSAIELRSNWRIYLDEFAQAVGMLSVNYPQVNQLKADEASDCFATPFEKKYFESGHALWCLKTDGLTSRVG